MLGHKRVREEVKGGWSKLHDEGVHDFCSSARIIRKYGTKNNETRAACDTHGGM